MHILAYGEFDSSTFWGMFWETLPYVLRMLIPALFCYMACSILAESIRLHLIGVLVYVLVFVLLSPGFFVMGAYGPAHVGMDVGILSWPGFATILVIKVIALHMGLAPRAQPWLNFTSSATKASSYCLRCGYDLRAGHSCCPECGALHNNSANAPDSD